MKAIITVNDKQYDVIGAHWDTDGKLVQVTYIDEHAIGHVLVHNPAAKDMSHAGMTYTDLSEIVSWEDSK